MLSSSSRGLALGAEQRASTPKARREASLLSLKVTQQLRRRWKRERRAADAEPSRCSRPTRSGFTAQLSEAQAQLKGQAAAAPRHRAPLAQALPVKKKTKTSLKKSR